ncbi:MAG: prenyltransferase [Thiohalospira sp.]
MATLQGPIAEGAARDPARWLVATRPPFLLAALPPVGIGLATAGGAARPSAVLLTLLGALLAHAAANVLNDWADARSGTDAANRHRVPPFTGGAGLIQSGRLGEEATLALGLFLVSLGLVVGALLAWRAGPGLMAVVAAGGLLGWGYSARPLNLVGRGLGEATVAVCFGGLLPLGVHWAVAGAPAWAPLIAGLPYGLVAAALLFINQFPDRLADARAGKHHWVVRLGTRRARRGYPLLLLGAAVALVAGVGPGPLPPAALIALAGLLPGIPATRRLWRDHRRPARLRPALAATVALVLAFGALLVAGLVLGA